jgi:hypothetical protein
MTGGLGMVTKLLAICVLCAAAGLFYIGAFHNLPAPTIMPGLMQRHVPRIVVLGSGLAGTAAAISAAEAAAGSAEVVVLEKEPRTGGNSMKASSGINALSPDQGDSADVFREDTLRSGGGLSVPGLVDALVVRAAAPPAATARLHGARMWWSPGKGAVAQAAVRACCEAPGYHRPACHLPGTAAPRLLSRAGGQPGGAVMAGVVGR